MRADAGVLSNWFALVARQAVVGTATLIGLVALGALLSPGDFAVYGYAMTVMVIAAAVGDLGLGAALIREGPSDRRIQRSLGLQLAVWLPLCAVAAVAAATIDLYHLPPGVAGLLAFSFLLFSLQTLPTSLLERSRRFGTIAKVESSQRVLFVCVALAFALLAWDTVAIATAAALAAAAGYAAALVATRWRWRPRLEGAHGLFFGFSSDWWQGRLASQLSYAVYPLLGGLLFTQQEVGWLIWAVLLTSIPAVLVPLGSRVLLPNIAATEEVDRLAVFERVFRLLLLVSLPAVAALFAVAGPLTHFFFGSEWDDAVPILRLECVTTVLGLVLTPVVPLLYLVADPRTVKRVLVVWASAVWALTLALASGLSYYAPSVAQIATAMVALVVFDRLLRSSRAYSLVHEMWPQVMVGAVTAILGWVAASRFATDGGRTLALAALVFLVAFAGNLTVAHRADVKRMAYVLRRDARRRRQ